MSKQNPLKEAIQSYLDERAKTDELFAVAYKKKNKSIDECCTYIYSTVTVCLLAEGRKTI